MAFTTYSAFVAALAAMTVTSVTRAYTEPPQRIASADLPVMFPRIPSGSGENESLGGTSSYSRAECELVVVLESTGQDNNSVNFPAAVTMMDNLEAAFRTNIEDIGIDSWSINVETDFVGVTEYWLIIATVEASG